MKVSKLRGKSTKELQKLLEGSRDKMRQLRFNLVSGKVKNYKEIREIKKDIARIMTVLKE